MQNANQCRKVKDAEDIKNLRFYLAYIFRCAAPLVSFT